MRNANALIVFVRNPVLGNVKTRIAATLGNADALAVYLVLLQHTKQLISPLRVSKHIFYADQMNEDDLWNGYDKYLQVGETLGDRMKNAFGSVFEKGYKNIVIIGSDCFELTEDIVNYAIENLHTSDIVIGPARDGGYYLLGMRAAHPYLFENIQWSSETVFQQTIELVFKHNLSFILLPELSDVDEAEDITFDYKTNQ